MGVLSNISSTDAIRAFHKVGWRRSRQVGSHIVLVNDSSPANLSVPQRGELAKGTLRALIRTAGLTVEEFLDLLK